MVLCYAPWQGVDHPEAYQLELEELEAWEQVQAFGIWKAVWMVTWAPAQG